MKKLLTLKITNRFCVFNGTPQRAKDYRHTTAQSQKSLRKIHILVAFRLEYCISFLAEFLAPTLKQQNHQWYEQTLFAQHLPRILQSGCLLTD